MPVIRTRESASSVAVEKPAPENRREWYTNRGEYNPMAARSRVRVASEEPLSDRDDFASLDEEDESSAEEIHALIEREKNDFISFEEYAKRRGISLD